MPCNCSGVRLRRCSCKVFGYPLATSNTQNVVLVEQDTTTTYEHEEKLNFVINMFERFYERCAGYNLRYCPLRGKTIREKHLTNVAKNVFIMMCFLFANSIVFLNIISRIGIHMYYVFLEMIKWVERYALVMFNRHVLNSKCDQAIIFNPLPRACPE